MMLERTIFAGYGVYAVDHPGFGLSEGLHGYFSNFNDIVDNVIEQYTKNKGLNRLTIRVKETLSSMPTAAGTLSSHRLNLSIGSEVKQIAGYMEALFRMCIGEINFAVNVTGRIMAVRLSALLQMLVKCNNPLVMEKNDKTVGRLN
ncbi:hypothetical protein M8C21_018635, partial [Ambrosia artemisiifolia]